MKRIKPILCCLLLGLSTLVGCNQKKEEPITNKDESTIIKNAKNVDEYLKKKDYKSIAYAYIYNIKEGLKSYESETNGTVKAKVLFFNYDIKYNSVTHKMGEKFYSKDNSTSTLMNVQNEFYMVDKEKILVSRDLKKYDVYTLEDYQKVSYSPNQYLIMGYAFNDESITNTELVSDQDDVVSIKYTLDNDASTRFVKSDLKNNGGLTSYPVFKNIEFTLSMKRDFSPISYAINATYNAEKPVIGSTEVKQSGECLFSKINETITIANEASLAEKLGVEPSKIVINEDERSVKDELIDAAKKLDFANGVNVSGDLSLSLLGAQIKLNIDSNLVFDVNRLSTDKIYNVLSFYGKVAGDDTFNTIISLVKTYAGDKLGEYKDVLDSFKSLDVVYDGDGSLYFVPTNQSDKHTAVLKVKVTDALDLILRRINVYNLVSGSNEDLVTFKKTDVKDKDNYKVEIILNDDTINSFKEDINNFFANSDYAIIKTLLGYKDFDSIKLVVTVKNGVVHSFDASFNYVKEDSTEDTVVTLASLHLDAVDKKFDFTPHIESAKALYDAYTAITGLKARITELNNNVYVSRGYIANVDKALAEYQALTDQQKDFFGEYTETDLKNNKEKVNNILLFLETFYKYDLDHLTNQDILSLAKAYKLNTLDSQLLKAEIGEEKFNKLTDLQSSVDYTSFDATLTKISGEDENAWGLTVQEIKDVKLIFDISHYDSGVSGQIFIKLLMKGITLSSDVVETKINNLYNNISNQ